MSARDNRVGQMVDVARSAAAKGYAATARAVLEEAAGVVKTGGTGELMGFDVTDANRVAFLDDLRAAWRIAGQPAPSPTIETAKRDAERRREEALNARMARAEYARTGDAYSSGVYDLDSSSAEAPRINHHQQTGVKMSTVAPSVERSIAMYFGEVDGRLAQTSVWPDGRAKQWLCDSGGNQEDVREGRWDAATKTIETANGERYGVNGMRSA